MAERGEVDARPGTTCSRCEQAGEVVVAAGVRGVDRLLQVMPAGSWLPRKPAKMMLVACPRILGPMTVSVTLRDGQHEHEHGQPRSGLQPAQQPLARTGRSSSTSRRACRAHPRRPAGAAGLDAAGAASGPGRWRGLLGRSLMRRPRRGAGSARSRRRCGQVSSSSSCVPMPTIRPSSSTTIWSASTDRGHPLGDDDHRGVAGDRPQRGPQPRVGGRGRARENESSNR